MSEQREQPTSNHKEVESEEINISGEKIAKILTSSKFQKKVTEAIKLLRTNPLPLELGFVVFTDSTLTKVEFVDEKDPSIASIGTSEEDSEDYYERLERGDITLITTHTHPFREISSYSPSAEDLDNLHNSGTTEEHQGYPLGIIVVDKGDELDLVLYQGTRKTKYPIPDYYESEKSVSKNINEVFEYMHYLGYKAELIKMEKGKIKTNDLEKIKRFDVKYYRQTP